MVLSAFFSPSEFAMFSLASHRIDARVNETTVRVRGDVNVENVNDATGIDFPEGEEFESIAGFVFNSAGRLVDIGERFEYEDATVVVEAVDNTRIQGFVSKNVLRLGRTRATLA